MNVKKIMTFVVLSSLSLTAYSAETMPMSEQRDSSPMQNDQDSMNCMHSCPLQKAPDCHMPMEPMSPEKNPMPDPAMNCQGPCMSAVEACPMQEMKNEMASCNSDCMPSGCERIARSMTRESMKAYVETLMRRCILLVDCDFARGVMSVDVDFYRDEENAIELLITEYANNPEEAEGVLNQIATDYVNEHGDALIANLVQGSDVTDVELIARVMRPLLQRTLMCKIIKAMHQRIVYKGKRLHEIRLEELKAQ